MRVQLALMPFPPLFRFFLCWLFSFGAYAALLARLFMALTTRALDVLS